MAQRGLKLRRLQVAGVDYGPVQAFRLRVEAHTPTGGMDPHVFLFLQGPYDPLTGRTLDVFQTVCGPVDLRDYPVGAPDPAATHPFFRMDRVTLDLRATALVEAAWLDILWAVRVLMRALDRMDRLEVVVEATLGPLHGDPAWESDSLIGEPGFSESLSP